MWRRPCWSLLLKAHPKRQPLPSRRLFQSHQLGRRGMSANASDLPTYQHVDDAEDIDMYGPGGFHPIEINDELNGRYRIVDKLGQGGYSTIWLAHDGQHSRYVAVKVNVADHDSNETRALLKLSKGPASNFSRNLITPVLDHFNLKGPNGTHSCIVTPPARCNVAEAIQTSERACFPPDVARALAAQLVIATAYVHRVGFVHGGSELNSLSVEEVYKKYYPPDPHPVLRVDGQPTTSLAVPKNVYTPNYFGKPSDQFVLSEAKLWLADFGTVFDPSQETRTESLTYLQNQPPEVRFELRPLTFSSDIWSLGMMVFEVMGSGAFMNSFLWSADKVTTNQVDALGPLPWEWWEKWEARTEKFTEDGQPKEGRTNVWTFQRRFEEWIQEPRIRHGTEAMGDEESRAFKEIILGMLRFKPEERLTADQVLRSDWMRGWAIPMAEEAWGYKLLG